MPKTPNSESFLISIVDQTLNSLARSRAKEGAWVDSESEDNERETQVFKIGECLRPFYSAAAYDPARFGQTALESELLVKDTKEFLRTVARDGFFPSPYSQIPGGTDQHTDFAAFVLELCALVFDYAKSSTDSATQSLAKPAQIQAKAAFEFLLKPGNFLSDDKGVRWAGTPKLARQHKAKKESYTDTFFTSIALLALHRTLDHPVLALGSNVQESTRKLLRDAGRWIVGRFDGEFLTGDESKSNRRLVHTTWGLQALAETYGHQDPQIRKQVAPIASAYLDKLKAIFAEDRVTPEQEYLYILSDEFGTPLYYEDRSAFGGMLLTLGHLRGVSDLDRLLEDSKFDFVVEQVVNQLLILRSPKTGLWYSEALILSIHSFLVDGFLLLERRRGTQAVQKLSVSGHMIRSAVRDALGDEAVLGIIETAVFQRVLRIVSNSEQEKAVEEALDAQFNLSPGKAVKRAALQRAPKGAK